MTSAGMTAVHVPYRQRRHSRLCCEPLAERHIILCAAWREQRAACMHITS
jgi:hypothetical protein